MNRHRHPTCTWILAALLALPVVAFAGELQPPGPPAPTMKSLDEVPPVWGLRLDSTDGQPDGCNSSRFKCVMDDQAVLDRETGLVWQRTPAGATATHWGSALSDCLNLSLGGRRGWRLPKVEELLSLIDPAQTDPALPPAHPFLQVGGSAFWTASTSHNDTPNAIEVLTGTGQWFAEDKDSPLNRVWCVRGGPPNTFTSQPNS